MWKFFGFLSGKIILSKVYKYTPNSLEETSRINIVDRVDTVNKLFDGISKINKLIVPTPRLSKIAEIK